ncbi:hypothetical protein MMC26_007324 [Xylographa opegraphella]|nr:hypothetical protein [Xylographa opegraphella]
MSEGFWTDALYSGTFILHRLSPLNHPVAPPLFAQETLLAHSRRLNDALKGDILRGVRVGRYNQAESTGLGRIQNCHWRSLMLESTSQIDLQGFTRFEGIHIALGYKTNTYTAFILRSSTSGRLETSGQTRLPLLLTRMPSAVRDIVLDYLTPTFDVRIEPMRLSSHFIENVLERLLEAARPQDTHNFETQVRSIQLVLGFKAPIAANLRNLAINIRREDVLSFLDRGRVTIQGKENNGDHSRSGPFMCSIRSYIKKQTALDMHHCLVTVSRLTCAGFALAADGKVKVVPQVTLMAPEGETTNSTPNLPLNVLLLEQLLIQAEHWLH